MHTYIKNTYLNWIIASNLMPKTKKFVVENTGGNRTLAFAIISQIKKKKYYSWKNKSINLTSTILKKSHLHKTLLRECEDESDTGENFANLIPRKILVSRKFWTLHHRRYMDDK